ncbi:MAG TPA: exosortase-associated EpsI family protein [Phycisphaerae bacterium]|nr:exosortase-associated EpsI family protein [Phycisphaerae bacterium]HOM52086.1 exosortase-associated EpsI family protein [Phycisphaerae bacterium]HON65526.1 exosortase-associated EpsI family protein [Phycisphaerae bacterium]HPP27613.1 exosortase-associated EpsI family protein [Phycisphaerae bacterium]HPU26695.1 exosortase-associated EpsI family protein [Phycisphaerae bacterium]
MSSEHPQTPAMPMTAAAAGSPVLDPIRGAFRNRGFLACLILLIACAACFQILAKATNLRVIKAPVWPRKPLKFLDQAKLAPYVLVPGGAVDIKPEILDALGTREYIQWTLEDTSVDQTSPVRYVHLFVTYYTDDPGQVPHVPEECYQGGGYQGTGDELITIPIPELGQDVPFKVLTFERSAFLGRESRIVLYTFHTNGRFAADRHLVRTILMNPTDTHAYFSKLELSFGTPQSSPTRAEAIEAAGRFLRKVVPVLVNDHWPDWKQVEAASDASGRADSP